MKRTIVIVAAVTVIMSLVFAGVALATSQATIDEIIADAGSGTLDGNWGQADVEAALAYLEGDPLARQYSDVEAVLEAYLAGGSSGGGGTSAGTASGGNLAFTGADILVSLVAGGGLIGGGLLLRRRSR
jgi:hypothetical protein